MLIHGAGGGKNSIIGGHQIAALGTAQQEKFVFKGNFEVQALAGQGLNLTAQKIPRAQSPGITLRTADHVAEHQGVAPGIGKFFERGPVGHEAHLAHGAQACFGHHAVAHDRQGLLGHRDPHTVSDKHIETVNMCRFGADHVGVVAPQNAHQPDIFLFEFSQRKQQAFHLFINWLTLLPNHCRKQRIFPIW